MVAMRPLSQQRIVEAAAAVADRGGLAAVSMRNVGKELGVEAMSLYHHVAGKDALLDSLAEWLVGQIALPEEGPGWREAMTARAKSARDVFGRHPWGLGLMESRRRPALANLRYYDAILGCLRGNGFPVELAAHAFSVIDAYVFGFVLTEANLPMSAGEDAAEFADQLDLPADDFPHLAELVGVLMADRDYDYGREFTYGLDLVLDGLAARLDAEADGAA